MKAVLVREPGGFENTRIDDVQIPKGDMLIRVKYAGLNPVDINTIRGQTNYRIEPYPHIPGAEFVGTVEERGKSKIFDEGDRVLVYPRLFDGICDHCISGREEICRRGGVIGVASNGGFAEFYATDEKHLFQIPDELDFLDAVSLPVGGLTAYHALKAANLERKERVLVVGASGNTGQYGVMLAKAMGADVYYISRKSWIKKLGGKPWSGETVDVLVNSLGSGFWEKFMNYLDTGGRLVTFGTLTGTEGILNIAFLYTGERKIIGSTGGTPRELSELIQLVVRKKLKSKLWKVYPVDEYSRAIANYDKRDGRIVLRFS